MGARAAEDGRRAVNVKRYGISVRVPDAWRLINWARDEQAFALKLPQDGGKSGHVSCALVAAPDRLEDYQQRMADGNAPSPQPAETPPVKRKLLENHIDAIDAGRYGADVAKLLGRWLVTAWELQTADGRVSYEVCVRAVHDGTLYSFSLDSDEAHYDAYRLDFEDMLASAQFSPLEIGLQRMPNGYWMQRDFRFALRMPEGWKPAFGPNDRVLFYATGDKHGAFTDHLLIQASPARLLDLQMLRQVMPEQVFRADPHAHVTCNIVPQGGARALETVIHTAQADTKVTIIERRFSSPRRNYEVRFVCEAELFKKLEAELRKALDSFVEVVDAAGQSDA